jgi:hypothetical protein
MICITHKTTHTTGHVGWRIGSEGVQEEKFNGLNINEVNPVAPGMALEGENIYKVSERQFREDPKARDMATGE